MLHANHYLTQIKNLSRLYLWLFLLIPFAIITIILLVSNGEDLNLQKVQVHYIARYSILEESNPLETEKARRFAKRHEIALQRYLEQLTREIKIEFEFIIHDNQSSAETSKNIYRKIAQESDDSNLIVLDNTWGSHIRECQGIIQDMQIPVIAMNADHNYLDYGQNVVFGGYGDKDPIYILKFMQNVLKKNRINFITEDSTYSLTEVYEQNLNNFGISIDEKITVPYKQTKPTLEDSLWFIKEFEKSLIEDNGLVTFVNTHGGWGEIILGYLNSKSENMTVAFPIFSTSTFENFDLSNKTNEYIIFSAAGDASNKRIVDETSFFKNSSDSLYFDQVNVHEFIERCVIAVEIIKSILPENELISNGNIVNGIKNLNNNPINTKHDIYAFEKISGSILLIREPRFSSFKNGVTNTYQRQINSKFQEIPNLYFGMEIENIHNLDLSSGRYSVDFYYWTKIDSSYLGFDDIITFKNFSLSTKELLLTKTIEDNVPPLTYKLYKVTGDFSQAFNLVDYPFDEHSLEISAEILIPASKLTVSFDKETLELDNEFLERINLEGWNKLDFSATVDNKIAATQKGISNDGLSAKYKTISYNYSIKRKFLTPFLALILPIVIIGMIAIGMLFLKKREFSIIGEASSGLLVSIILLSISLNETIPNSNSLTLVDKIYWMTLIIVFINFFLIVVHNSIFFRDDRQPKITRHIGKVLIIIYPLLILFVVLPEFF